MAKNSRFEIPPEDTAENSRVIVPHNFNVQRDGGAVSVFAHDGDDSPAESLWASETNGNEVTLLSAVEDDQRDIDDVIARLDEQAAEQRTERMVGDGIAEEPNQPQSRENA